MPCPLCVCMRVCVHACVRVCVHAYACACNQTFLHYVHSQSRHALVCSCICMYHMQSKCPQTVVLISVEVRTAFLMMKPRFVEWAVEPIIFYFARVFYTDCNVRCKNDIENGYHSYALETSHVSKYQVDCLVWSCIIKAQSGSFINK